MLQSIVLFSLRFRGIVIASACLLLGYGLYVADHAKLDVFPEFVQAQVTVQTEAPGLSPEQVEALVTVPVESAINGLGNMESMRSESIQGLSIITAVFREGTDVLIARQMLSEKLGEIGGKLAAGVQPPRLTPLTSSTMDLLKIGLVAESKPSRDLRAFADYVLKPRLLAVPGVAKCSSFGGDVRQIQIQLDSGRLIAYGLSIADVVAAARASTGVVGAGFVETANQRLLLQTEGQSLTAEALGDVLLSGSTNGLGLRLRDVGHVVEGTAPKFGDTLIQGKPGVLLTMSSQYGANTMEVTRALEAALQEMAPVLKAEGITLYDRLHRPATFIETALANVGHSLLLGGVLVAVVLLLFLGNLRAALISITAIPLSLLTAVIILDRFGATLNTITLGGLAIAIGEVVDDAIIDVENICRRLRENATLLKPLPVFDVILKASLEVRTAVVYATFVVALVFLPVLTLTGVQGKFFAPLALSYILAILASLGVALTLTPALSCLVFGRGVLQDQEPALQRGLKRVYLGLLQRLMPHPGLLVLAVAVFCAGALLFTPHLGEEFLPAFRERHFVLQVSTAPGTSLPEMRRLGTVVSQGLMALPGIATVEQQIGRAELGEDPWGPHRSEFHVDLKPVSAADEAAIESAIRSFLVSTPGIQFEVLTFLGDRIGETIAGETAPVVLSVFGQDLEVLDAKADEIVDLLKAIPGASDVQIKSPPGSPRIAVKLQPEKLRARGLLPLDVMTALQTAYQGTVVAQTYEGNRVVDVAVTLDEASRSRPEGVATLMIRNAQGVHIPLSEVATVYQTSGRHSILHDGGRRRQTITCNPKGRDVGSFVAEARERIAAKVAMPAGSYVAFTGAAEAAERAEEQLGVNSLLASVGILMLLSVVFRTPRNLALVLANLPFALVGGVLALTVAQWISGASAAPVTIGSLVGFVTLFGITTRNSIMLISHFEHLVSVEGLPWSLETALRGAGERLIPIAMTALVTALGLVPLAWGAGEAGREIEGPMARVILGGLLTSTVLNLLVLPALALRFGRFGLPTREGKPG